MGVKLTVEHNGEKYSAEINKIDSTFLGKEDHGILTAYLQCKGDGTGVGVGGYSLDAPGEDYSRIGHAYGIDWLLRVMSTVGVDSWEKLPGQRVLVLFPKAGHWGQSPVGIANIDSGEALIFKDLFAEVEARETGDS